MQMSWVRANEHYLLGLSLSDGASFSVSVCLGAFIREMVLWPFLTCWLRFWPDRPIFDSPKWLSLDLIIHCLLLKNYTVMLGVSEWVNGRWFVTSTRPRTHTAHGKRLVVLGYC